VQFTKTVTTWKEFRQRYTAEALSGRRGNTARKYGIVFNVFEQEMKPGALRDITAETVSKFTAALRVRPIIKRGKDTGRRGLSAWSIHNYLVALRTALQWAADQKLIASVPTFPAVKVPKLKPQPIREEDWQALYNAAPDDHHRAYLLCGWWGGLRLSEAQHLQWEPSERLPWLDFQRNRVILPAVFAKSDEDQWIPLHPVLRRALEQLPRIGPAVFPFRSLRGGGPLSDNALGKRVTAIARRAGVRLSMHRLRKGFGCRVAQQLGKGDAPVLHRLMRHSSMQITMDYYASVDDVLQDKIEQLDSPKVEQPQRQQDAQQDSLG
jgi:integrase